MVSSAGKHGQAPAPCCTINSSGSVTNIHKRQVKSARNLPLCGCTSDIQCALIQDLPSLWFGNCSTERMKRKSPTSCPKTRRLERLSERRYWRPFVLVRTTDYIPSHHGLQKVVRLFPEYLRRDTAARLSKGTAPKEALVFRELVSRLAVDLEMTQLAHMQR